MHLSQISQVSCERYIQNSVKQLYLVTSVKSNNSVSLLFTYIYSLYCHPLFSQSLMYDPSDFNGHTFVGNETPKVQLIYYVVNKMVLSYICYSPVCVPKSEKYPIICS